MELELNEVYERTDSMEPLRREKGAEEKNTESYVGWHILNSREMRKKRLEEVQEMYLRGDRFATIVSSLVHNRESMNRDANNCCTESAC